MSELARRVTILILQIANFLFHGLGCHLLLTIHRKDIRKNTQSLYLINMAASKLVKNFLLLIRDTIILRHGYTNKHDMIVYDCINMFTATGMNYIDVAAMFLVTGDRLLRLLLHAKYTRLCRIDNIRKLLAGTWSFNLIAGCVFSLFYYIEYDNASVAEIVGKLLIVYLPTALFVIFLLFALFTYCVMFMTYARSHRSTTQRNTAEKEDSLCRIFLQSKFFVSVLLIGSNLLLMVIPGLVRSAFYITTSHVSSSLTFYYLVSTRVSDFVDGIIYTFFQPKVRGLLCKCWWQMYKGSVRRDSSGVSHVTDGSAHQRAPSVDSGSVKKEKEEVLVELCSTV